MSGNQHQAALMGVCVVGASLIFGCRRAEVEPKPEPPVVDDTLAAFESPTLVVDETIGDQLRPFVDDAIGLIQSLDLQNEALGPILDALEEETGEDLRAGGDSPEAHLSPPGLELARRSSGESDGLAGEGFLRVTRICPGWEEPVVDEAKNGKVVAIAGFTEAGLDPVLWADFFACRYPTDAGDVLADQGSDEAQASIILALGESVPFAEVQGHPIVFIVDLEATISGEQRLVQIAFRNTPGEPLYEILFETEGGTAILLAEANALVGIRAKNGTYQCDAMEGTCTEPNGGSIAF